MRFKLLTILLITLTSLVRAHEPLKAAKYDYLIMFYNVENLFDPFHDTLMDDYEFVGGSIRGWSWNRFNTKLQSISKVINEAGEWTPPEIIGLCEVENRFVLIQLLKRTPLDRFGYRFIHEESPDQRGIDVALLYRSDSFKEICHESIRVTLDETESSTRDILYIKGETPNHDTLHLFVNHWPSRTGGPSVTKHRRKEAALCLKHFTDSIAEVDPRPLIIIMGDFNDEPTDESLAIHLDAKPLNHPNKPLNQHDTTYFLHNLMFPFMGTWDVGTNKFKGVWGIIDQFIVSSHLLSLDGLRVSKTEIFSIPSLLVKDEAYNGTIPFRTYNGMHYLGGFSDHLPILLHLEY